MYKLLLLKIKEKISYLKLILLHCILLIGCSLKNI